MVCPCVPPRSPQRAGDVPGNRCGLLCPRRGPPRGRPPADPQRGVSTLRARGSPSGILEPNPSASSARAAGLAAAPAPPFNPHTVVPAPRFCP